MTLLVQSVVDLYGLFAMLWFVFFSPLPQVLQHILHPAFLYSFEKGEGEQLLGPPNPEGDNPESITSVFITKVMPQASPAELSFTADWY